MSDPLYKYVNVINPRTGLPVIDKNTRKAISRRIQMTKEEAAAFESERETQNLQRRGQ